MEGQSAKQRAKSALHWENNKARECLTQHGAVSLLVAELVRDYLDFYSLDYTQQIFMPESGLGVHAAQRSRDKLAEDSRLRGTDVSKPLLVQILEKFTSGQAPAGPTGDSRSDSVSVPGDKGSGFKNIGSMKSKGTASAAKQGGGGIEFSDDKNLRSGGDSTSGPGVNSAGGFPPMSMGIGEGILQHNK